MFDLTKLRKESGLTEAELAKLELDLRAEFPHDEMMFELHLVRVLDALHKGWIAKEQLLAEQHKIAA